MYDKLVNETMKKHLLLTLVLTMPALCMPAQESFDELLSVLRREYAEKLQKKEKIMRTSGNNVYANTVILELNDATGKKMTPVVQCLDRMLLQAPESNRYRKDDTLTYTMIWREALKDNPQLPDCYHFQYCADMARDLSVRSFLVYQQHGRRVRLVCRQTNYLDRKPTTSTADIERIDSIVTQISKGRGVKTIPVRYSRNMRIGWLSIGNDVNDITTGSIYRIPPSEHNGTLYGQLYDLAKEIAAKKQTHLDLIERNNTVFFQYSYREGLGLKLLPDGGLLVMRIGSGNPIAFPVEWYKYKNVSQSGIERIDAYAY